MTKSICNPCFDGDHSECVDPRCECPCKPRMTKTNLEDDWEKDWKEFYGLYGDIGRSEEDIKDFIRQHIVQEQEKSQVERKKDREEIIDKLEKLLQRYLSVGRIVEVLEELKEV